MVLTSRPPVKSPTTSPSSTTSFIVHLFPDQPARRNGLESKTAQVSAPHLESDLFGLGQGLGFET